MYSGAQSAGPSAFRRLRRFAWGRPVSKRDVPGQACHTTFAACSPRYGFAVLNLAAIPPHICREESRQKCSGHPGSPVSSRPSSWIVCPSWKPCYGPSRPRPRRESASPTDCRALTGAGSLWSPIPCTVKARHSNASRHPPGSSGRQAAGHWWLGDSVPHRPDAPDTPNHQRLQDYLRPNLIKESTGITRPEGEEGVKTSWFLLLNPRVIAYGKVELENSYQEHPLDTKTGYCSQYLPVSGIISL